MTISRQEFDEGRIDLSVPILDFLAVRRDAFTGQAIFEQLIQFGRRITLGEVVSSLRAYPKTPDARKVIKAQAKCSIAT